MAGAGKEYVLGRGKVYFDAFTAGTTNGTGERYFGNTPEFSYTVESESLDHYDADEGINVLDEKVQTRVDLTGQLVTDNVSIDNLSLFLQAGSSTSIVVASASNVTQNVTAKKGVFFQIGASASLPQGARNITVVSVTKSGSPVTATGNYTVDAVNGRLYIEPTSGAIADGDALVVTYNVAAGTRNVVISKDNQLRGALRFISANAVGNQMNYFFPYVLLTPNGDYALKGEDWQQMGFSFTALKRDASTERVYAERV